MNPIKKKTKILLIKAPDIYTKYGRGGVKWLPTGLGELAAYIMKKNKYVEITILEPSIQKISFRNIVALCCSGKYDIIGISYLTVSAPYAYQLSKFIKKYENILLIHGGLHPSTCPKEVVNHCDLCVMNEGEETFLEIIKRFQENKLELNKIKGIAYKKDGDVKITPPRDFIKDLDEIPFPAYELLPMDKHYGKQHYTGKDMVDIMESRGCPHNCSFCVSPIMWKRKLRMHSPEYIYNHLRYLKVNYKINSFHFHGDNFMIHPDFVIDLCNLILKNKLNIEWCALTRPEHIIKYQNLLPLMKKAGCIGIEVGIDSAEPNALKAINKGQSATEAIDSLILQKKYGMVPIFTLMAFNPEETIYGYYKQQKEVFMKTLGFKTIRTGQTSTPYPSTDYAKQQKKYGILLAHRWDEYDHTLIPFIPYSLLNGKPRRIKKKLGLNDFYIILGTYYSYRIDIFPANQPFLSNFFLLLDYLRKLKKFYSMCTGRHTLHELATIMENECKMIHEEAMRFCGFCTLMLAKMGLITDMNLEIRKRQEIQPIFKGFTGNLKSLILYLIFSIMYLFGNREKAKVTF